MSVSLESVALESSLLSDLLESVSLSVACDANVTSLSPAVTDNSSPSLSSTSLEPSGLIVSLVTVSPFLSLVTTKASDGSLFVTVYLPASMSLPTSYLPVFKVLSLATVSACCLTSSLESSVTSSVFDSSDFASDSLLVSSALSLSDSDASLPSVVTSSTLLSSLSELSLSVSDALSLISSFV